MTEPPFDRSDRMSLVDPFARALWLAACLMAFLPFSASSALAQAGGGGTGGAERQEATPTGNRNPAIVRGPRTMAEDAAGVKAASPLDGLSFGPGSLGETVAIGSKGIVAHVPDLDATWRIGGRLHLDAGVADTNSRAFASAFQNTLVRRAFIESYLSVGDQVEVAFQYDTAPSDRQPVQDAGVSFHGPGPLMLSVGNFKEPMGFDQLTSDNDTLFLERALSTALTPGRNLGGMVGLNGERWTFVAGAWGGDPNTGIADEGVSGIARVTFAPILTAEQVLHLGLSGSYRALDRASSRFTFETTVASTPEMNLLPARSALVSTGTIAGASAIERVGAEVAYQFGSVRVQGEATRQPVVRATRPDVTFASAYVEAGWVLNGDGRPYRLKPSYGLEYAEFGGVSVEEGQRVSRGGIGIFEVAARLSVLDLSDRDVRGGLERNATFGLNWYPERNLKVIINYIYVDTRPARMNQERVRANVPASRLQFYW